jgi:hypothetical protein
MTPPMTDEQLDVMVTSDNITVEQIKSLWRDAGNGITGRTLMAALNEPLWGERCWSADEVIEARARCAEILNSRKGIEP